MINKFDLVTCECRRMLRHRTAVGPFECDACKKDARDLAARAAAAWASRKDELVEIVQPVVATSEADYRLSRMRKGKDD